MRGCLSVSAVTGSNGGGGSVSLSSQNLTTAGPVTIHADGDGTGSGGNISVVTGSPVVIGASGITVTAKGGSGGANGGTVTIGAAQGLTVTGAAIDVSASGAQGAGGIIYLSTGPQNVTQQGLGGTLAVSGTLNADGSGTGSGGTITLGANGK
jgi:hypothetical protein